MKPVAQPNLIKSFVQHTLGCSCPEAVFSSMLTDTYAPPGLTLSIRRLLIGSRLLIYLFESDNEQPILPALLEALADHARRQRDENGYNRARLVVVSTRVERDTQELAGKFSERFGSDQKLHLHIIDRRECPFSADGSTNS